MLTKSEVQSSPILTPSPSTSPAHMATFHTVQEPKLCVRPPPNYYYFVKNRSTGLVLQAHVGEGPVGKAILPSHPKTEDVDSQLWYLEDTGDTGYYYIVSKLNGLVLDVSRASYAEGTPVIQWSKNAPPVVTANQKWKIELDDGYVVSQLNGQVIEMDRKSIFISKRKYKSPAENQQWTFEPWTDRATKYQQHAH